MRSLLLLICLLLPLPSLAQSDPEKTQQLIDEAEKAWNKKDCETAYPLLKEAYLQSSQTKLLTSIGQCAAYLQLDTKALAAYCAYQTLEPQSPYRETIDDLVKELSAKTEQGCPESSIFLNDKQKAVLDPDTNPPTDNPINTKEELKRPFLAFIFNTGLNSGTVKGVTDKSETPIAGGFSLPEVTLAPEIAFYATSKLTAGAIGIIQLTNTAGQVDIPTKPQPSVALRARYFYSDRRHVRPFTAGELGFGQFVQNFPTNFGGNNLGKDSTHNVGPFLGLSWGFEEKLASTTALTGGFSLRGYLADNPVTQTEDIPLLLINLSLGIRFSI